jgi:hypothetical protein
MPMNWSKVIIALEQAAREHQDRANMLAVQKNQNDKDRAPHFDATAALLRDIARALKHGQPT